MRFQDYVEFKDLVCFHFQKPEFTVEGDGIVENHSLFKKGRILASPHCTIEIFSNGKYETPDITSDAELYFNPEILSSICSKLELVIKNASPNVRVLYTYFSNVFAEHGVKLLKTSVVFDDTAHQAIKVLNKKSRFYD